MRWKTISLVARDGTRTPWAVLPIDSRADVGLLMRMLRGTNETRTIEVIPYVTRQVKDLVEASPETPPTPPPDPP